jgi:hypothetical protein
MPISISGWGLRKIAVISLLGQYTIALEKGLALFSVPLPPSIRTLSSPNVRPVRMYGSRARSHEFRRLVTALVRISSLPWRGREYAMTAKKECAKMFRIE